MPIWSEILEELSQSTKHGHPPQVDDVRRKYLGLLNEHTGRGVILYASGWIQKPGTSPELLSIGKEDIQALMEVTYGMDCEEIDLVLHSPGGEVEAAEALVSYLRSRFSHIRVIVPNLAMSAATMLACSANEIVLGKHSFLGPTDPQLLLTTPLGLRWVAAQAILDQFSRAQQECADQAKLRAWVPMLQQYGPDLLTTCEAALRVSKELVENWLAKYMFADSKDGPNKALRVSDWLADHKEFNSHNRHIARDTLRSKGLVTFNLEDDPNLQDLCLSVFHATTHTFARTPVTKVIENHMGRAFIKIDIRSQALAPSVPVPP